MFYPAYGISTFHVVAHYGYRVSRFSRTKARNVDLGDNLQTVYVSGPLRRIYTAAGRLRTLGLHLDFFGV